MYETLLERKRKKQEEIEIIDDLLQFIEQRSTEQNNTSTTQSLYENLLVHLDIFFFFFRYFHLYANVHEKSRKFRSRKMYFSKSKWPSL